MAGNRISIVIPTRNRAHLLRATLACVHAQTWTDREIVVVDEASTDDTARMVASEFPDVKIVHNEAPRGPGAARNIGIGHASGDWLFFWDDDDLMHPSHLEELLQATLAAPENCLVSGRARCFAVVDDKVMLSPVICAPAERSDSGTLSEFFDPGTQRTIAHSTILWPRRLFDAVKWDEELLFYEDFDLCGQAILAGRHIVGREVGMYYIRMHAGARVTTGMSAQRFLSPAIYRLKWSDLLKARPEFRDCTSAMRNGLMELIIDLSGRAVARPLMPRLMAAFQLWGGRRFYITNPPRNRAKRAIAYAALRLGGPVALRFLLAAIARLRPMPTAFVASLTAATTATDLTDVASISLFLL
jgi:glycosyltransferase involved in cell wall biosynthesis